MRSNIKETNKKYVAGWLTKYAGRSHDVLDSLAEKHHSYHLDYTQVKRIG